MKISILTLFPQMIAPFCNESIIKRAQEKGAVEIEIIDMRQFAADKHGTVDQSPYGGGAGMVLMVEPVVKAIRSVVPEAGTASKPITTNILLTSAKGKTYNQAKAKELSQLDHIVIIAGHYEGFDERVLDYIDEEVSIGDFVMTGGEITATAIMDSVVRLLPGVLKKEGAAEEESYFEVSVDTLLKIVGQDPILVELQNNCVESVQLLEYPHYTRPEEFEGKKVPEILFSGHHKNITEWRLKEAFTLTKEKRPDLLR